MQRADRLSTWITRGITAFSALVLESFLAYWVWDQFNARHVWLPVSIASVTGAGMLVLGAVAASIPPHGTRPPRAFAWLFIPGPVFVWLLLLTTTSDEDASARLTSLELTAAAAVILLPAMTAAVISYRRHRAGSTP